MEILQVVAWPRGIKLLRFLKDLQHCLSCSFSPEATPLSEMMRVTTRYWMGHFSTGNKYDFEGAARNFLINHRWVNLQSRLKFRDVRLRVTVHPLRLVSSSNKFAYSSRRFFFEYQQPLFKCFSPLRSRSASSLGTTAPRWTCQEDILHILIEC
jgi:hypothetical protein